MPAEFDAGGDALNFHSIPSGSSVTRLAVLLLSALLLAATLRAAAEPTAVDLPRIGEPADTALSPQEERKIGAHVTAQLYAYDYVLEDAEVSEYVAGLTWRLVAASEADPPDITVFVIRDPR